MHHRIIQSFTHSLSLIFCKQCLLQRCLLPEVQSRCNQTVDSSQSAWHIHSLVKSVAENRKGKPDQWTFHHQISHYNKSAGRTDSYKLSDWGFTVQQRLSTLIINLIWISNLVTYDWYYKRIRSIMEAFNRFFLFRISWNSPYHSFQQRLLLVLWSNTSSGSDQQLDTISWRQIYTYSFQWWKLCRAATT